MRMVHLDSALLAAHTPPPLFNTPVRRMTARDPKSSSHPPARACTHARLLARHRHAPGGILRAQATAGAPPSPGGMRFRPQLCHSARRHGVLLAGAAGRPPAVKCPPGRSDRVAVRYVSVSNSPGRRLTVLWNL